MRHPTVCERYSTGVTSAPSLPPELSDRMDALHRALAARLLAEPDDPTEELIDRYRQRDEG
jgi:hypothetical protein